MRKRLNQQTINAVLRRGYGGSSVRVTYVWDTELKGFGCKITPTAASWIVQKWLGGRQGKAKRVVIGQHPVMSLHEARKAASIAIGDVLNGADLVGRKEQLRQQQQEQVTAPTFGTVVAQYLAEKNDKELTRRFRKNIIPALGSSTQLVSIQRSDIKQLLKPWKAKGRNSSARIILSAVSMFYRWCLEEDYVATSPLFGVTRPKPPKARERYLTPTEIKAYWSATESLSYPWKQFYQLLLLTTQRRDEVASLEWSEIELDRHQWVIPSFKAKNGKEHIVHLTDLTLEIIQSTPHRSGYVFSTNGKSPISGSSKAKKPLPTFDTPYVIHDLRRTFATHAASLGVLPDVADRVLNHVSGTRSGVKGVYQRYEFIKERREALELWSHYVAELSLASA